MPGFVYILQSLTNGGFYIGSSTDIDERLQRHNTGRVTATRNKGLWKIVFSQEFTDIKIAKQIEFKLKKYKSRKIIEKIIFDGKIRTIGV